MNPSMEIFDVLKTVANVAEVQTAIKQLSIAFDTAIDAAKRRGLANNSKFPSLDLELRGDTLPGTDFPKVFGNSSGTQTSMDYSIPGTLTYWLTIIYESTVHTQLIKNAQAAIDAFLINLHPKLGKDWVDNFRIAHSYTTESTERTGKILRTVSKRVITVNVRPYKSALIVTGD